MMKKIQILILLLAFAVPSLAQELNVMSYNIRNSGANDGENSWELRKKASLTLLKEEKPDLLGLQEALPDQYEFFNKHTRRRYGHVGVGRDDGKSEGECMAVYYKKRAFKCLGSGTFWLSETPDQPTLGWDAACKRTVTWVHLRHKKTGREVYYFNTHLDHKGPVARRESILLICRTIAEMVPEGATVVLSGDMNSNTSEPIFAPLAEAGLLSSRDVAPVTDNRSTYNGWKEGNDPSDVIDHIFVRGCEPLSFRVLRDKTYGAPFLSDHYPIVLRFRLPEK
ncbi:MAG: endonuclease/exonuclease/phosphatase family protein [Bacteroidaceae bacterium]|nr:endonuclease/exonuclease/phosphatase family protein [Bacteroidaceae bacterium]